MIEPQVRSATIDDIPDWIALARDVEPLFGPMPDIEHHIRRGINRDTALVVTDTSATLVGAALLSRSDDPHQIHWLAVSSQARRQGAGRALLQAILDRWNDGHPIDVITFGADIPAGAPARAFYAACGFTFAGHAAPGPKGDTRERWTRL